MKRYFLLLAIAMVCVGWMATRSSQPRSSQSSGDLASQQPVAFPDNKSLQNSDAASDTAGTSAEVTIADVIDRAKQIQATITDQLDDYTATFVKQERDREGQLSPQTVMDIKIQTRVRGPENQSPMRVFLRFKEPQASNGRKVIWGSDLYNGQMAVHEPGMLLSLKTIWLDPEGIIAMQGQRYPIWNIGFLELVKQLIERGEQNLDLEGLTVDWTPDHSFDGRTCELYRIERPQSDPSDEDDFKLAEIVLDPERNLVLAYRSFGWPEGPDTQPPLLESYAYKNVKTNVGLTDKDFDVKNPEYGYPAF